MKTILNKTHRPLRIHLSQGKILHLGPGHEGKIATQDAERESLRRLVEAGEIEIVGEGGAGDAEFKSPSGPAPDTHGFHPPVAGKKRGER